MARTASKDLEAKIVAGARAEIAEAGVGAFTQRAVAKRAGVSLQSIYNRFADQDDLLDAVANEGFLELTERLLNEGGRPLTDISDPVENIVEGLARYRRFTLEHPEVYSLMFDARIRGFTISDRTLGTAFESLKVLVDALGAAIEGGVLRPADPITVAQQIWAAMHGLLRFELTEVGFLDDWEQHYFDTLNVMLRGLQP